MIRRVVTKLNEHGICQTVKLMFGWVCRRLGVKCFEDPTYRYRAKLSKRLNTLFSSTVAYGPLKGFQFAAKQSWSGAYRASMLLGLYEQEVLEALVSLPDQYETFIDLGAADGYYGVGVLVNNHFKHSICFEATEGGRDALREASKINRVQEKVQIKGYADSAFYNELKGVDFSKSVLFVDIEGGEFDLLSDDVLNAFKSSVIFIELHDWYFSDGDEKRNALEQRVRKYFDVIELTMGARDLSCIPELDTFCDPERWLLCSEDRGRRMTWLQLMPKDHLCV